MREDYTGDEYVWFVPVIVLTNKCDDESLDEICQIFKELLEDDWPIISISAETGRNLEQLKQAVFDSLDILHACTQSRLAKKPTSANPW